MPWIEKLDGNLIANASLKWTASKRGLPSAVELHLERPLPCFSDESAIGKARLPLWVERGRYKRPGIPNLIRLLERDNRVRDELFLHFPERALGPVLPWKPFRTHFSPAAAAR